MDSRLGVTDSGKQTESWFVLKMNGLGRIQRMLFTGKLLKGQIFWEGQKGLKKNSHLVLMLLSNFKKGGDFLKILWPSQNIWTLLKSRNLMESLYILR